MRLDATQFGAVFSICRDNPLLGYKLGYTCSGHMTPEAFIKANGIEFIDDEIPIAGCGAMNWCERLRDEKNMTKQQLADAVGVALRTVYRWERNGLYPRANHFSMLELVGGKSIQELCPEIFDPTR